MRTPTSSEAQSGTGAAAMATLVLLFFFVSLTPFRDLTSSVPMLNADAQSNLLNQIVSILIFAAMMGFGLRQGMRELLVRPFALIAALVVWVALVTVIGPAGMGGMRRVIMAAMLIGMASVFLLLPRDERHLAGILAIVAGVVLGLSYFGVIFLPRLSIHQAEDIVEPLLAGDWRGLFNHKNIAAPAMVLLCFVGLFVARARSQFWGWTIVILAGFFVFQSGGKTAMTLLPLTLVLAWLIERGNLFWRAVILFGVVGGYSALTIGATLNPGVASFITSFGIDATFTGRADIWQIAIGGIEGRPLLGYGYGGFWGTEGLVYGFREEASWAVTAPTAHNSYVEMLLIGGVVGLALALVWLVLLPLRDLSQAIARHGATPLMRLYTRIWVFCLIFAGMESLILSSDNPVWFLMLVAVFGLRHEARAYRRADAMAGAPVQALPALQGG